MLRVIFGVLLLIVFFFTHLFFVQVLCILGAVLLLPLPFLIVLPATLVYDSVFSGDRFPLFSIIATGGILLFYLLKPYLRR